MDKQPDQLKIAQELTKKTLDRMQNSLFENARQQEDLFFNGIINASKEARTKLPEEVFVKNFLPFFSGKQSIKEHPGVVPNWIGIAGSPTAPVDIIDPAGEVLFTVPAFYDTTIVKANSRFDGLSLSETMAQYELEKAHIPQLADSKIKTELSKRMPTMFNESSAAVENKKAWNTIFDRYGIPSTAESPKSADKAADVRDDLEYD